MPAKGFLNLEQKERLQILVRSNDSLRLREHALILLLQNDGKTYEDIANFIGCGYRTVAHWCVHGDPDNLDSLKDKRQQGNYRKATEQYIELLLETVEKAPEELGYEFGRWTGERLSTYPSLITLGRRKYNLQIHLMHNWTDKLIHLAH